MTVETRLDGLKREALGDAVLAFVKTAPLSSEEALKLEGQFLEYFEKSTVTRESTAVFFSQHSIPETVLSEYRNNLKELVQSMVSSFSRWLPPEQRSAIEAAFQSVGDAEQFLQEHPDVHAYLHSELADGRNMK